MYVEAGGCGVVCFSFFVFWLFFCATGAVVVSSERGGLSSSFWRVTLLSLAVLPAALLLLVLMALDSATLFLFLFLDGCCLVIDFASM